MFRFLCFLSILFIVQPPTVGFAGSLQVSPTYLDLSASQNAATVELQNMGGEKVNVQARIFKWTQVDGREVLTPTSDVIVSPPAAAIVPGVAYTLRLLRRGAAVGTDGTYRLLVDELPVVNVKRPSTGVSMLVRHSLPISFNTPSATADLTWNIRQGKGGYVVEATNRGTRHAKITDLKVGSVMVKPGLAGYVLPGAKKERALTGKAGQLKRGATVQITASGSDYGVNAAVEVGK